MVAVFAEDDGVDVQRVGVLDDEFVRDTVPDDALDGRLLAREPSDRPDTAVALVLRGDGPEFGRTERRLVVRPPVDDTEDVEAVAPFAREFDRASLGGTGRVAPVGSQEDASHVSL